MEPTDPDRTEQEPTRPQSSKSSDDKVDLNKPPSWVDVDGFTHGDTSPSD